MAYVKVRPPVKIYHLTGKDNLNSILDDGVIRRFNDTECWFCESLDKMRARWTSITVTLPPNRPWKHCTTL